MMDVSVVIPTRDRSFLLASTLRSVLRQRGVEFEVIVVDDGSRDDTLEVIGSFESPRLRTVRHTASLGPNAARNRGIREASGRWVAFLDDDDVWAPNKLAGQLRETAESRRAWGYAGSVNVNERLDIIHGVPPPTPESVMAALPRYNPIPASASNVVIDRATLDAVGGFDERLRTCEEWDLWLRLAAVGAPACVPEPLVGYRMHAGNAILDVESVIAGAKMIEQLHGTDIDWGRFHRWIAQVCIRGGSRGEALRQYLLAAWGGQAREAGADLVELTRTAVRRRLGHATPPNARRADAGWEDRARDWIERLRRLEASLVEGNG